MDRVFVCSECVLELFLDTPTSLGYQLRQGGRCRHVDQLIEDEIQKRRERKQHQSAEK
jgi:hypothetical protein